MLNLFIDWMIVDVTERGQERRVSHVQLDVGAATAKVDGLRPQEQRKAVGFAVGPAAEACFPRNQGLCVLGGAHDGQGNGISSEVRGAAAENTTQALG